MHPHLVVLSALIGIIPRDGPSPAKCFCHNSSVSESNDRGSWFGFSIEKGEQVSDPIIYGESKAFAQSASSGAIDAKPQEPKQIQAKETKDETPPF